MAKYPQPKKDPFKKSVSNFTEMKTIVFSKFFEDLIKEVSQNTGIPSNFVEKEQIPNPPQKFRKDDMMWRKQDGTMMLASEMQPDHLFYALRFQYNLLVPLVQRVGATLDNRLPGRGLNVFETLEVLEVLFRLIQKHLPVLSDDKLEQLALITERAKKFL